MEERRCIALYSGGLDSIIAVKLLMSQGIDVIPLFFATPFFGLNAIRNPEEYKSEQFERYGLYVHVIDYTDDFIQILVAPKHGYGRWLNPCIDCKIGMLNKAKSLLEPFNASFIITGEVLGQRPMSQRRDTMNIIARDAGCKNILLRPLSAKHMAPTEPELSGIVDRGALLDITGRGRKPQLEIARSMGIKPQFIPTPTGGCLLTNAEVAAKVRHTIERLKPQPPTRFDLLMDVVGRKFILDGSTTLIVARNEEENRVLSEMVFPGNTFMRISGYPGPLAIMRGTRSQENLSIAASICQRYSKARGMKYVKACWGDSPGSMNEAIDARLIDDNILKGYQFDFSR